MLQRRVILGQNGPDARAGTLRSANSEVGTRRFAVRLIGLAGPCVEVIDRVQVYKSFTRDTATLDVILGTE